MFRKPARPDPFDHPFFDGHMSAGLGMFDEEVFRQSAGSKLEKPQFAPDAPVKPTHSPAGFSNLQRGYVDPFDSMRQRY